MTELVVGPHDYGQIKKVEARCYDIHGRFNEVEWMARMKDMFGLEVADSPVKVTLSLTWRDVPRVIRHG